MSNQKHIADRALADVPTQIVPHYKGTHAKQYEPASTKGRLKTQVKTDDPLLTRDQLSTRWSYCIETLKRWEKAGNLPFMKLGKEVRYRLSAIEEIENRSEVCI